MKSPKLIFQKSKMINSKFRKPAYMGHKIVLILVERVLWRCQHHVRSGSILESDSTDLDYVFALDQNL